MGTIVGGASSALPKPLEQESSVTSKLEVSPTPAVDGEPEVSPLDAFVRSLEGQPFERSPQPKPMPLPAGSGVKAGLLALGPRQGQGLQNIFNLPNNSAAPPVIRDPRARANAALENGPVPRDDHPMMVHTRLAREQLTKEGLPTSAAGSEIYVLGENPSSMLFHERDHADGVVRSVAGPASMGRGAEVHLREPASRGLSEDVMARTNALRSGQLGLDDSLGLGVDRLVQPIESATQELKALRESLPADGKTRIANMSWGQSVERISRYLATDAVAGGPNSAILKDVNAEFEKMGQAPLDLSQPKDASKLQAYLSMRLQQRTGEGPARAQIEGAKSALTEEVSRARAAGILPIVAAGNEGNEALFAAVPAEHHASLRGRFQSMIADVPGVLTVGVSNVGQPGDVSDDRPWAHTNFGAALLAPGRGMPVSNAPFAAKDALNADGTSYSAPYVAGVAGLMLAANPKLSVDQVESILRDPRVLRDIPGDVRDGGGVLDEVAAVRLARDFATQGR